MGRIWADRMKFGNGQGCTIVGRMISEHLVWITAALAPQEVIRIRLALASITQNSVRQMRFAWDEGDTQVLKKFQKDTRVLL